MLSKSLRLNTLVDVIRVPKVRSNGAEGYETPEEVEILKTPDLLIQGGEGYRTPEEVESCGWLILMCRGINHVS